MSLIAMVAAQVLNVCTLATVDRAVTPTRDCLTCHDGTVKGISLQEEDSPPSDVNYAEARLRTQWFREPTARSNRVFPGGLVTCTTCHDTQTGIPQSAHWLAMGNERSSLCFACHAI